MPHWIGCRRFVDPTRKFGIIWSARSSRLLPTDFKGSCISFSMRPADGCKAILAESPKNAGLESPASGLWVSFLSSFSLSTSFASMQRISYYGNPTRYLVRGSCDHKVLLGFSRPGEQSENANTEVLNSRLRQKCLNASWFLSVAEARARIENWRIDYNRNRPNSAQ